MSGSDEPFSSPPPSSPSPATAQTSAKKKCGNYCAEIFLKIEWCTYRPESLRISSLPGNQEKVFFASSPSSFHLNFSPAPPPPPPHLSTFPQQQTFLPLSQKHPPPPPSFQSSWRLRREEEEYLLSKKRRSEILAP